MNPPWTPAEDKMLRRLWSEGVLLKDIAIQIGRSYETVKRRKLFLRLPERPRLRQWTSEEDACLIRQWAAGVSPNVIYRILGRSIAAVIGRAKELGLPPAPTQDGRQKRSHEQQRITDELKAKWTANTRRQRGNASLIAAQVESIADYLARGGTITRCPSAYAAPVEHAMPAFGRRSGGRRG